MKPFYDFLHNFDGRICFIICVVCLVAVFLFALVIMSARGRRLPLGRITVLAAIACGLLCYFATLCTADAAFAPANAAVIIAIGGLIGLLGAAIASFGRPRSADADNEAEQKTSPAPSVGEAAVHAFVTEDLLPEQPVPDVADPEDDEVISAIPLPTIDLPQAAQPNMSFDEVLERAESVGKSGVTLAEAKELVTQINKLKVLPENSSAECQQALMLAQQNIVAAVKNGL